ncbi:hypothetical protein ACTPOK_21900 [Streptomyces inhibens]|uniref:hypothetical protein n=1 Tax=Streptomyces inhibens TaxID=2293571 RepID=UPI00402AA0D2
MVQVWVNDVEAGRLAPPDPRDRKPRTAYKPQVIQRRMGHESITTTVDTYGHLLDALDDEVVAAVEWAMDLTAPLPGFLEQSGLASATGGLPRGPRQSSVPAQETWKDADDAALSGPECQSGSSCTHGGAQVCSQNPYLGSVGSSA